MKRFLSFYWMSVDTGVSNLSALITYPIWGILSKFSRSFRERANIYDTESSNAFSKRGSQNERRTDSACFALPGLSLFCLLLILGSLFNVPIRFYHFIIFLVLIMYAVYWCISTAHKNKESYEEEFYHLSDKQRKKWIMLSCLFVLVCIVLPIVLLPIT